MSKQVIQSDGAPSAIGPYSQAIRAGDFIFVSGQLGFDVATGELVGDDVQSQTHQVLKNVGAILEAAGATLKEVVRTTIYLADMNDFDVVNETYASYFTEEAPARVTVEVSRLPRDVRVEIDAVAYMG